MQSTGGIQLPRDGRKAARLSGSGIRRHGLPYVGERVLLIDPKKSGFSA